jgi:hypothetical protein
MFTRNSIVDSSTTKAGTIVHLNDFNKDGFVDMVVASTLAVEIRFNDGFGFFPTVQVIVTGTSTTTTNFRGVRGADMNRDGNMDLIVVSGGTTTTSGFVRVYTGSTGQPGRC